MTLTPLDVDNISFRGAFKGYDREQVDQFRADVLRAVEGYIDQVARLKLRVAELEAELKRFRETEELLNSSIVLAQRTSDELKLAAQARADAIVETARAEAATLRSSLSDLAAQREQFEYSFHGLLTGFINRLEQANPRLSGGGGNDNPRPARVEVSMADFERDDVAPQPPQQPESSGPIISIDMEDLTSETQVPKDTGDDDTVVIPMAAPEGEGNGNTVWGDASHGQRGDSAGHAPPYLPPLAPAPPPLFTPPPGRLSSAQVAPPQPRAELDADASDFSAALDKAERGDEGPRVAR